MGTSRNQQQLKRGLFFPRIPIPGLSDEDAVDIIVVRGQREKTLSIIYQNQWLSPKLSTTEPMPWTKRAVAHGASYRNWK